MAGKKQVWKRFQTQESSAQPQTESNQVSTYRQKRRRQSRAMLILCALSLCVALGTFALLTAPATAVTEDVAAENGISTEVQTDAQATPTPDTRAELSEAENVPAETLEQETTQLGEGAQPAESQAPADDLQQAQPSAVATAQPNADATLATQQPTQPADFAQATFEPLTTELAEESLQADPTEVPSTEAQQTANDVLKAFAQQVASASQSSGAVAVKPSNAVAQSAPRRRMMLFSAEAEEDVPISPLSMGAEQGVDFGPYITSSHAYRMENGQWQQATEFTDGEQARIELNYQIDNNVVTPNNHTIYYQMPSGVLPSEVQQGTVYDNDKPVGTYEIGLDGRIEIQFDDDFVVDGSGFFGSIYYQGTFSVDESQTENRVQFGAKGDTITVVHGKAATDLSVKKAGSLSEDGKKVSYVITASTTKGTDGTVTITDHFGDYIGDAAKTATATYDADSFVVTKVDAQGNRTTVTGVSPTIANSESGKPSFTIDSLPQLAADEKYEIAYTASVDASTAALNGSGETGVGNWVRGDSGGDHSEIGINVKVSSKVLDKWGGYNSATGTITWVITVNSSKEDISGLKLTDTMQIVDKDGNVLTSAEVPSFPATAICKDSHGNETTIDFSSGSYTFPDGSNDCYTIVYDTQAPDGEAGTTDYVKNTVTSDKGTVDTTTSVIHPELSTAKSFSNSAAVSGEPNLENYWWNAVINLPEGGVAAGDELVYTDTIQDAVDADGNSVEGTHFITWEQLNALTANLDGAPISSYSVKAYSATDEEISTTDTTTQIKKFTLTFDTTNAIAGKTISLRYATTANTEQMEAGETWRFANTAAVPGHETTASHDTVKHKQLEKQVGIPDEYGYRKWQPGSAAIDYESSNGVVPYRVLLTTSADDNGNIVLTDTLPAGMKVVLPTEQDGKAVQAHFYTNDYSETDSYTWWDADGTSGDYNIAEQTTYTEQENADGTVTLTITIPAGYNHAGTAPHRISVYYSATMADDPVWDDQNVTTHVYSNRVAWNGSNDSTTTTVNREVSVLKKDGEQLQDAQGNLINRVQYCVAINPAGKDLSESGDTLTLHDTLSNGATATLLPETVKLYAYSAKAEHNIGAPMEETTYGFTVDPATHALTVTIPDETPCVLVYVYQVALGTQAELQLENNVELEGVDNTQTSDKTDIKNATSGADVGKGTLYIYKVDSTNFRKLLSGAVFALDEWSTESNNWQTVGSDYTTDEHGCISFYNLENASTNRLKVGTLYRLTETTPPTGYAAGSPVYFVWMDEQGNSLTDQVYQAAGVNAAQVDKIAYTGGSLYVPNAKSSLEITKAWQNADGTVITDPGVSEIQYHLYQQKQKVNAATLSVLDETNQSAQVTVAPGTTVTFQVDTWQPQQVGQWNGGAGTLKQYDGVFNQIVDLGTPSGVQNITLANAGEPNLWNGSFTVQQDTTLYLEGLWGTIKILTGPSNQITPDGERTLLGTFSLPKDGSWSALWPLVDYQSANLDAGTLPLTDESGNPYYYTVEEIHVPGYDTSYQNNSGTQTDPILIINTRREDAYTLPETGGVGTECFWAAGIVLCLAAAATVLRRRRRTREGGGCTF